MKAEDLRIGNYLNFDGTILQVSSIHRDNTVRFHVPNGGSIGCFHLNNKTIKPIPLTEEWLVKLGFELKNRQDDDKDSKMYHKNQICDIEYGEGSVFWHDNYTSIYHKSITYVHDLQNIYHAIMGQELTIKEKVNG